MARTPKVLPERNEVGVEYPLNDAFISNLASICRTYIRREIQNHDAVLSIPNDRFLALFAKDEDRQRCREAPAFFGIASERLFETKVPGREITHEVTFRYMNSEPGGCGYRLPSYASNGPVMGTLAAAEFCMRVDEVRAIHQDICRRWATVYGMVTTLNRICRSVTDILANFPALEVLVRDSTPLTGYLRSRRAAVSRITKMPPEMRAEYIEATRTVTRTTLMSLKPEQNSSGTWLMDAELTMMWPSWWRSLHCRWV